eukprot:TRINITY_DN1417_c0_g1_i2.p1 TRINITY_DN1417_c0_g1~~TRINITY_DN1417_c0_g1_i2.p1  ORF type:complete len:174 (+),score=21.77 TRINITY_DN1417_c0_g1_i2:561-1082(+)
MQVPAVQTCHSYYRRSVNRRKFEKKETGTIQLGDETISRISIFFAYPTPVLKGLCEITRSHLELHPAEIDRNVLVRALGSMATVCLDMAEKKRFVCQATNTFCLRVMTGSLVLYDHVSPLGLFVDSPVDIREVLETLTRYGEIEMVYAIQFGTEHLNDPETPASIKSLFERRP